MACFFAEMKQDIYAQPKVITQQVITLPTLPILNILHLEAISLLEYLAFYTNEFIIFFVLQANN